MRATPSLQIAALLLSAALVSCSSGSTGVSGTDLPPPTVVPLPTVAPTPTATATPTPTPTPTASEELAGVAAVQEQLRDLGYYVGDIDGKEGPATASAVQAFQKVNGLSADGVIGPNTLAALADPVVPDLRGGPANRVEVDLDEQVMYFVQGGDLQRILPVSSGSGGSYDVTGGTALSVTPVGTYRVERRISGERHAELGTLYDPLYFYRGWAIHGSNSVPSYPASHGCVRVTRADAKWLFQRVDVGMSVVVYGDLNSFDPAAGETAGTTAPAGDTPDTTPDDGIQTEEPTPAPSPSASATPQPTPVPPATEPGPETEPAPAPVPPEPQPTDPAAPVLPPDQES